MATIALSFPTVEASALQTVVDGGHCYNIFPEPTITVKELLESKVLAEFRKARAGGRDSCSLELLLGHVVYNFEFHSVYEPTAVNQVLERFVSGDVVLLVDGHRAAELDQIISLTRRTGLQVCVPQRVTQQV